MITACSRTGTEPTSTIIETPLTSPTSKPTLTPSSTATTTRTPSPTLEPFGTQIGSTPIALEGDIFIPFHVDATYHSKIESLPTGVYIIDRTVSRDTDIEDISYVSISDLNRGLLIRINKKDEFLHLRRVIYNQRETRVLGGYPGRTSRYLVNLSGKEAFQFTICNDGLDELNPSGHFLATMCTESGQVQSGSISIEIISLDDGTSLSLELPSHSKTRYASNRLYWVGDDHFIAHVGMDEEPCLINLPDLGMLCAPGLDEKPLLSVSPLGTYLLTNRSIGATWIKDIHLLDCFTDQMKCDPIVTLDDDRTGLSSLYWSPDETMLAADVGDHLTSTTAEIGFYDTETWTYHYVSAFPRSSGFFEWCPDSSCMIILGDPSYILYLDGTRQEIPHDFTHPIALIEVP
jgi:hypothetical protein